MMDGDASAKRGRGRRFGRGRGGKRGGPGPTQDALDKDLENYMMKDTEYAKSKLDNDLDEYMKDVMTGSSA
jgi:hypothetical protein